jgi:hypothetical protein
MSKKYEYKPSNLYAKLWRENPDSQKAFELIVKHVEAMITVVECCKKPALLALDRHFANPDNGLTKYKTHDLFKRMCGEIAKQVIGQHSYEPFGKPANIERISKFFKNASNYKLM